jgi:hypothetical protein
MTVRRRQSPLRERVAEAMEEIRELVEVRADASDEELRQWVETGALIIAERLGFPVTDRAAHRNKLNKVITDAKRLLEATKALGTHSHQTGTTLRNWDPRLDDTLKQTIERSTELVRRMPDRGMMKRSGGAQASTMCKRIAVDLAVKLMTNFGDALPTVASTEKLAAKFFEVALERDAGNMPEVTMRKVTRKYFKKLEEAGYPNARQRRLLDEDGKQAARDWLNDELETRGAEFLSL